MGSKLPDGVSHCGLHDQLFPGAMLCPSCVLGGTEDECIGEVEALGPELFDGMTASECLVVYERLQREPGVHMNFNGRPMRLMLAGYELTPLQLEVARREWSAALRARVEEKESKERAVVVVDDDRWEL